MIFFSNTDILKLLPLAIIPLIIYLILKQKKKNVKFSSLYILKKLFDKAKRKKRIRNIYLLIIRTLIAITLILLLAGPIFTSGGIVKTDRHLIILDDSYCSNLKNGSKTVLENSIAKLSQDLEQSNIHTDFYLFKTSGELFANISKDSVYKLLKNAFPKPVNKDFTLLKDYLNDNASLFKNQLISLWATKTVPLFIKENFKNYSLNSSDIENSTDPSIDSVKTIKSKNDLILRIYLSTIDDDNNSFISVISEDKILKTKKITKSSSCDLQIPYSKNKHILIKLEAEKDNNLFNNEFYLYLDKTDQEILFLGNKKNNYANKAIESSLLFLNEEKVSFESLGSISAIDFKKYAGIVIFVDDSYKDIVSNKNKIKEYCKETGSVSIIPVWQKEQAGENFFRSFFSEFNENPFLIKNKEGYQINKFAADFFNLENVFGDLSNPGITFLNKLVTSSEIFKFYQLSSKHTPLLKAADYTLMSERKYSENSNYLRTLHTSLDPIWSNIAVNGFIVPLFESILKKMSAVLNSSTCFYSGSQKLKHFLKGLVYLEAINGKKIDLLSETKLYPGFYMLSNETGKKQSFAVNFFRTHQNNETDSLNSNNSSGKSLKLNSFLFFFLALLLISEIWISFLFRKQK